jgi:glucitol/sorbitol PTS system EIIA component
MDLVYKTTIGGIGQCAKDFLAHDMFVIFKDNAPQELVDYCYIHNENNLLKNIEVEDILIIDEEEYKVTGVGSIVNQNLRELGHITLKFSGEDNASMGGTLYLEKKEIVPLNNGTIIKIIRN